MLGAIGGLSRTPSVQGWAIGISGCRHGLSSEVIRPDKRGRAIMAGVRRFRRTDAYREI